MAVSEMQRCITKSTVFQRAEILNVPLLHWASLKNGNAFIVPGSLPRDMHQTVLSTVDWFHDTEAFLCLKHLSSFINKKCDFSYNEETVIVFSQ